MQVNKKNRSAVCPVCGSKKKRELWRNEYFFLYGCLDCGSNFQKRFRKIPKEYDTAYFEGNHQKTYGKTYLGDEKNIRGFSRRRLDLIASILGGTGGLLDIGSALGIFCDEARKKGFKPEGVDVSKFARGFAKKYYGIKSYPGFDSVKKKKYDCVTIWFTLEHMEKPAEWIRKVSSVLLPGSILALSVPNGQGTYSRFNPRRYHIARPSEHYFEPTVKGIRGLLMKNGFDIVRTEVFGLHPERFGFPAWKIILNIIKFLKWGDTFEIYARKR